MVRDLAWVFSSSPIIESSLLDFEQSELDLNWLQALDKSANKINDFMSDKNLKMLGPYFEALWEFYFKHYPGKRLIAKNIQVFENNKTVGEFDFIYLDEVTNEYCHLEVAVKYYLGVNSDHQKDVSTNSYSMMRSWVGPNVNDQLDKKTTKMIEHQTKLSQTSGGKQVLAKLGINKIKTQACLLGYLFYPAGEHFQPPEHTREKHNRGYWLKLGQLEGILLTSELWMVINKPHWMSQKVMSRQQLDSSDELLNKLNKYFSETSKPILISNFELIDDNQFVSVDKYFVVPDCWPLKTKVVSI